MKRIGEGELSRANSQAKLFGVVQIESCILGLGCLSERNINLEGGKVNSKGA